MKRFESLILLGNNKVFEYSIPEDVFDESRTDRSHFVPTAEAVKRLAGAPPIGNDVVKTIYDFPDGVDNGATVPISRNKGVDLAVLSDSVRRQQAEFSSKLLAEAQDAKERAIIQKHIDSLASKASQPPSAPLYPGVSK